MGERSEMYGEKTLCESPSILQTGLSQSVVRLPSSDTLGLAFTGNFFSRKRYQIRKTNGNDNLGSAPYRIESKNAGLLFLVLWLLWTSYMTSAAAINR